MLRRKFLKTSAGMLTGMVAAGMLPRRLGETTPDALSAGDRPASFTPAPQGTISCQKIKVADVCSDFDHRRKRCARTTPVWQLPGKPGYFYVAKMAVDVDGAPRAYHPDDQKPPDNHTKALDWLANLSSSDRHGIQGKDGAVGPEEGFLISGTSLSNPAFPHLNDTRHWVDGETIPYIVLTGIFPRSSHVPKIKLGDCAMVIDLHSRAATSAIFADVGSAVGEASMKTALNLGLDPTQSRFPPKVRGFGQNFLYLVFPNSPINPPWDPSEIDKTARALFESWGGMDQVKSCFP